VNCGFAPACLHVSRELGLIVSRVQRTKGVERGKHEFTCDQELRVFRGLKVIGSSEQVHVVDALAITGDEGRGSLRKASGSRQTGFDPEMSEWGNPARKGHRHLNS
jgi:hypothetical protein